MVLRRKNKDGRVAAWAGAQKTSQSSLNVSSIVRGQLGVVVLFPTSLRRQNPRKLKNDVISRPQ